MHVNHRQEENFPFLTANKGLDCGSTFTGIISFCHPEAVSKSLFIKKPRVLRIICLLNYTLMHTIRPQSKYAFISYKNI